ncbi:MAG: ABC transporter permease [Chloroflexota bacterium]|jgi:spermidine/putrescine transport system permease protein|nr:ABC transporter permease [Chloroflexota bacterium]MDH5242913.1 ABC transporter permease [Chloroflexota bacterium]
MQSGTTRTGAGSDGLGGRIRSALLTFVLILPAGAWYLVLLVAPLVIITIFSFGVRAKNGGYAPAFVLDNYGAILGDLDKAAPFTTSLSMAIAGTIGCLLVGLPLAYFIATRGGSRKGLFILLLVIPFWTSFLIRTYSWLIVLGPENLGGFVGDVIGDDSFRILGTPLAVLIGLVYGYLPLMVFPLYVTLERMDRTLVEASKDLGASRWATFRQVTLPIALPGLITGSILVFIPMMGEYVIPQILGYGRIYLVGNALVTDFLEARNWPAGSAKAVVLIAVMMFTVTFYTWFVNRGRRGREVSVL